MKKLFNRLLGIILLGVIQLQSYSQPIAFYSTGYTGTGSNIDVNYHRCEWTADPDDATKTLTGKITTYFSTTTSNVSSLSFDFNNNSFNNGFLAITYHGIFCTYSFPISGNTNILNINLPVTIANSGTVDSITINYQGIPPAPSGNAEGYQRKVDGASNNYIYTLSESFEDKDWWPCKADMQDKIDSLDIVVSVPNAFWVAANGVMTDSTITGANRIFKFKHRYPIASYLVALGIGKYNRYNLGNLPVGSSSVPFILNIFQGKSVATENSILNVMNNHKQVFAAFNNLFGDYPFAKEKHGFYEFGFSGGMEHQTFSGIGGSSLQSNSVLAHELAHQWWGDKATFSTWNHLWLAEGFATYSEVLAAEFVSALGISPISKLASVKSSARSNTSSSIYLTNIASSNTIWTNTNTTAIYNRGCMVASMLRTLLGDTKYFAACKNYLNNTNIAYKSATTNDLQTHMENQLTAINLSDFFNEWINKKGTPDYTVLWGNNGNLININLTQTITSSGTSGTASSHFPMPVILYIANSAGTRDTTITVYHRYTSGIYYDWQGNVASSANGNTISFNLPFTPATVTFDPQNRTMANATVNYSSALAITDVKLSAKANGTQYLFNLDFISDEMIESVELQQSDDGIHFELTSEMKETNSLNNKRNYSLMKMIDRNNKFYRAKIISANKNIFSNTIVLDKPFSQNKTLVFPNPFQHSGTINFENKNKKEITLNLVSIDGKVLQKITTFNDYILLNTSSYKNGTYVIQLFIEKELLTAEKILIKN